MDLNLLEKTELRIQNVLMEDVNLNSIAEAVAEVLSLPQHRVLVIDVRIDHFCLDILEKTVAMEQIIGREKELLERLDKIPGLTIKEDTFIDTRGIMGLISCDKIEVDQVLTRTQTMLSEIEKNIMARALIYATGFEVQQELIEDTNSPYLMEVLRKNGYKTEFGGVIEDSKGAIKQKLLEAVDRGFGMVITTGGVGAEDKDFSVEALTAIDPLALTPYIVQFEQGTGRHVKNGVRIGIGKVGLTTIINLPGPHDEVVVAAAALAEHCRCLIVDTVSLANDLAHLLREKLQHKEWRHHHGTNHY
ncbi:MAG TPA: molybdopterin-binding protein [Negativicutes bacterium]